MKTQILKWDTWLQVLCLATVPVVYQLAYQLSNHLLLLYFNVALLIYLIVSNGLQLALCHRSLGFYAYRKALWFALLIYLLISITGFVFNLYVIWIFAWIALFPVIGLALISSCLLGFNELQFLRKRQFFVLK